MSSTARRFGTAYVILWCQLVLGLFMLVEVLRLLPEQFAFAIGLLVSDGQNGPERILLGLHLTGYTALGAAMWMWRREDPRTWLMMKIAAGWQCLLAPAGLVVAGLLWWLSRHPEREEASRQMPVIAGHRRLVVVMVWTAANAAVFLAGGAAFFLLGMPLLWFVAMISASLPMFGAALLLGRARAQEPEAIMPPLPNLIQD